MIQRDLFEKTVLPLFEEHREEWLDRARADARMIGTRQELVTIDDVRALCPPPPDVDPRVMGAVFTRSEWESVGYQRSARRECHNRPVGVFRLKRVMK